MLPHWRAPVNRHRGRDRTPRHRCHPCPEPVKTGAIPEREAGSWPPQYVFTRTASPRPMPAARRSSRTSASFLPGVKIGVVGVNGSEASPRSAHHVRRDKDFQGEARAKGVTVGYLPQEPELDPALDVPRQRRKASPPKSAPRRPRYNEVAMRSPGLHRRAHGDDALAGPDRRPEPLGPRLLVDVAMEALRCPPTTPPSTASPAARSAASRSAASCSRSPTSSSTSRPTTSTPRPSPGCKHLIEYPHPSSSSPRPLLPRRGHRLDPRTRPRRGIPRGQLLPPGSSKAKPPRSRRPARTRPERPSPASSDGSGRAPRPASQAKAHQRLQQARLEVPSAKVNRPDRHPERPPPSNVINFEASKSTTPRPRTRREPSPPGSIVGVIGERSASKRRSSACSPGQERPPAPLTYGDSVQLSPTSISPATPGPTRPSGKSPTAST